MSKKSKYRIGEFIPSGPPSRFKEEEERLVLYFKDDEIMLNSSGSPFFKETGEINNIKFENLFFLGYADEFPCYAADASDMTITDAAYFPLRKLLPDLDESEIKICFRGRHLLIWKKENRFCGTCGGLTSFHGKETALICPLCGKVRYPGFSPAVITMVTKGDSILLAHNRKFPGGIHSLIAGFVEAGENLEETVRREIEEEVGLEVDNIRYFGSQSWPFPNSLMCGFTAEWKSGEIKPDMEEIDRAGWFKADALPPIPGYGSISRSLIDSFVDGSTKV